MNPLILTDGSIFAGRYRVERHLAAGGMGNVYETVHVETGRPCALKVMHPYILESVGVSERFRREIRVTASIRSDHIVAVLDAGVEETQNLPYLVMELLHGEDLSARLARAGRLSVEDAVVLLRQVALALNKMHRAGVVHRDLKPENLFITERDDGSPHIKVLDFGIAKVVGDGCPRADMTRELVGTPLYMAPEQFREGAPLSAATDIYSFGMLAYTMLVGAPYWQEELDEGASALVLASVAMNGPPERASARAKRRGVELPSAFDAWFARATAVALEDRFPGIMIAVAALSEATHPASTAVKAAMRMSSSRRGAARLAVLAAMVSGVAAVTLTSSSGTTAQQACAPALYTFMPEIEPPLIAPESGSAQESPALNGPSSVDAPALQKTQATSQPCTGSEQKQGLGTRSEAPMNTVKPKKTQRNTRLPKDLVEHWLRDMKP